MFCHNFLVDQIFTTVLKFPFGCEPAKQHKILTLHSTVKLCHSFLHLKVLVTFLLHFLPVSFSIVKTKKE